jgi:sulfur-oxidizing protein SoxY
MGSWADLRKTGSRIVMPAAGTNRAFDGGAAFPGAPGAVGSRRRGRHAPRREDAAMTPIRLAFCLAAALAAAPALAGDAAWDDIRRMAFGDRAVADEAGFVTLEAPARAHDASIVPIEIIVAPPLGRVATRLTLLIDENPAPVAAEFAFGPAAGREIFLATRVRVDAYSQVRAVVELDDGTLHQAARLVKASGGCAAPASKDAVAALQGLGELRFRVFEGGTPGRGEAQVLVKHPNHSGFAVDQVTLLPVPPHFVDELEVREGDALVFRMTGGISLSENPSVRFSFAPNGADSFSISAGDTKGGAFAHSFPATPGA